LSRDQFEQRQKKLEQIQALGHDRITGISLDG